MSCDKSRKGEYNIYKTKMDMTIEYKSIFGNVFTKFIGKGSKVYQAINYQQLKRTHYFSKPTGAGGFPVATISEVENDVKRFEFIGTKIYSFAENTVTNKVS